MVFHFYAGGLYSRLLFIPALDESFFLGIRCSRCSGPASIGGPCSSSLHFEKGVGSRSPNSISVKTIVGSFPICFYYKTHFADILCRPRIWKIGLWIQTRDYRLFAPGNA